MDKSDSGDCYKIVIVFHITAHSLPGTYRIWYSYKYGGLGYGDGNNANNRKQYVSNRCHDKKT